MDQSPAKADVQVAATALGGRDFEGQATKEINGKTYILIGNEQQLRAIGSGKKVIGRINKVTQTCIQQGALNYQWVDGTPSSEYAGDADLSDSDILRDTDASDHDSPLLACTALSVNRTRTKYYGVGADGTQTDYSAANTGLTYSADANYLIFRDIDLSKNAADTNNTEWTPLMFSGTMLGAVSNDGDTEASLWKAVGADGASVVHATAARPVISHVVVNQKDMVSNVKGDQLDVSKQQGIGFFASITNKTVMNSNSLGSAGTAVVSNLKLQDVSVTNHTSESYIPPTLLGMLTSAVGLLLDTLLKALKLLTFGQVDLDLNLQGLLTLHKDNPSNLATGAFAGRIYGDTKVTDCEVADVSVSSVSRMTGGFVGYVEGATRYDAVSGIVGALTNVLSKILGVIPFLGLGDLVDWLLSGTLGLNALIPVGYYNPVISNSSVNGFKKNVVIGNKDNPQAGGFVGAQIGAIIENSSVTSTNGFTVRATQYAGGFAGISRNGNVGGLINSLGVDLLSALRPQSLIENSGLTVDGDGKVTVSATDYAGGFSGAMANAYAVNNTISATAAVSTDKSHAGGFTGFASVGWGLELGTDDTTNASLLKQLTKAVTNLLSSNNGAGELLSIVGVNPSVILGTQMKGSLTVKAGGDYAGGLVGEGSGTVIGDSSQDHLKNLTFWKYNNPRDFPQQRSTTIEGLESVTATGSYAGGIAGNLQPTTVAGLLNSVVKIGDIATLKKFDQFAAFTVENMSVTAPASGLTVKAGSYYAGGAIGCATGGDVANTNLTNLATVSARGEAGGFIGFSGPGDAIGAGGLNVLGLIKLSGLLSVAQYSSVAVTASNVNGIANGFTVKATGKNENNETTDYAAGGFYGQANSTKTRESHVTNLKSVTADTSTSDGIAGGFVGFSTTGGLADALSNADDSSVLDNLIKGGLLSVNDLLGAMPYLIPSYTDTTVTYVNGGYVEGDIAGGYAGNFQSGKVNQFSETDLENDSTLADVQSRVQANPVAVVNLDHVTGGAYAGGFGGKVVSGALASAGNGGLSLLGKFGTVDLANLLQVVQGYVPFISYAGVHSDATTVEATSGNKISDPDDPGFTVSATRFDQSDTQSGSAGGYTGFMEAADTAEGGSLSLLGGLIKAGNLAGVLSVVYPTEEHSKVTGPLRNMSYDQWKTWVDNIGKYGAYGKEFTDVTTADGAGSVTDQDSLDKFLESYIFGFNVVAGRAEYRTGANLHDSGVAGGHVGLMRTGTITDGQSMDVKTVSAMRAAGGYAGTMESGSASSFGSIQLFGDKGIKLDLGQMLDVAQVFVPVVKSSSVAGYRKGMKVVATGEDITHGTGNAGGYAGLAVGGQIWGDLDQNGQKLVEGVTAAGANVSNLRKVEGRNNVGGFIGVATAGAVADVDTNASEGFLQGILDSLVSNPASLVSVLQATVTTIRGAHVSSDDPAWGYTVNGAYESKDDKGNTTAKYALNAGGFAGSLQAAILGDKDSAKGTGSEADPNNDPASLTVNGLRAVEGGQYAGGFFGLADVSSVASVGGGEAGDKQDTNLLLKLLKVGNVGVLEAFRTFIYDGQVNGVSDGIQIVAHDSTTKGMLDSKRYTGAVGGFGGGLINGSVKQSAVTNLNSVTGVNYVGGFIGHLGKSGTVAADNAQLGTDALNLLGATAGVLDIWGSHVGDSRVTGIPDGYTVTATHHGDNYGKATDKATGREVAGGFVGYVDLARVKGCTSDNLKKVTSGEIAGGFVGETSRAYLVDAKVNSVLVELLLQVVNALVKLLYLDKAEQVGVIDLGKWFPAIFGKVFDLKVLSEGDVLYVNLFGLKVSVALSKADDENQQQTDVAIVTIGDSVIKLPCSKDGIDMDGSGSNLTVQLIKGNRTRVEQSTVTGIANGYDVFGGGATQDTDGVKDLSTGYTGGFAGLNDEGVLADDHMVYADTIRGASGLVDPFSNTKLKSVWDFNTMSDILGPVDDGNGDKAYNTYRIYRKAAANASEARTSAQDGNKIFSQKNTADDALNTGLDRWEVKLFDVVNTYDSSAVHSSASGDAGTTWVGIKNAVTVAGGSSTKLDAYQSPAKAVLMLDATVTDNNGGLTPEPDDGQDPCGKDGCRTIDLTVQKVWKDGNLERPQSVELKIAAHYTDGSGNTVTPQTIQCFGADCTTVTQKNPWTVTLDSSDASSWSSTWRKVIQGLPVAFVDGQDANGKDIVRYYTYTVEETAVTYKDGDTTKTIKPAEAGYQVSVSYNTKERVAIVTNAALLPDTGGAGTMWFLMFGLLLMGAGVVWYVRDQRVQSGTARSGSSRIRKRGAHAA